ncbi:MAG: Flp pilus assembly protein CpaB [Eggerthellaceae bacterium]|jgi:pilus assembly protein CpaB
MRDKRMVVAGIISGIICAVAVFGYTQSVTAQADQERAEALERYGGEQVEVVVAKRTILPGETIGSSDVEKKMWLADLLPENSLKDDKEVIGKQVASTIVSGEVVTSMRFEQGNSKVEVPDGMTAVSLPTEEVKAVGGAISAGMAVDVFLTGSSGTKRLGKDVLVLATSAGESEETTGKSLSWVTVAVAPGSVEEYVSSAEKGNLYFAIPGKKES